MCVKRLKKQWKKLFMVLLVFSVSILSACEKDKAGNDLEPVGVIAGDDLEPVGVIADDDLEPVEVVMDDLDITYEQDKEFYILKLKDDYLEIPGMCNWVYEEKEGNLPELTDGQIALVIADVAILNGGEAGYTGNLSIEELKSYTILDYQEFLERTDIPNAQDQTFEYQTRILSYQDSNKNYLVVLDGQYVEVYLDGSCVMEYEWSEGEELKPFFAEVSGVNESNRIRIAEALGVEKDSRNISFLLSCLVTIDAGRIQSAEVIDGDEKVLKVVAEDGTEYAVYLSANGSPEAVKNLVTGEWPIQSSR